MFNSKFSTTSLELFRYEFHQGCHVFNPSGTVVSTPVHTPAKLARYHAAPICYVLGFDKDAGERLVRARRTGIFPESGGGHPD